MAEGGARSMEGWPAPADRRAAHWRIENELRERLLASAPEDREAVASEVYGELFARVPWHSANDVDESTARARDERFVLAWDRLFHPGDVVVDLGTGNGRLPLRLARDVRSVIGVEAAPNMVDVARAGAPANATFVVGSAVDPPLDDGVADVVVSRQVIEHLHPDDGPRHVGAAWRLLRPGGRFLLETPYAPTGPWDVSRGFTDVPTGFHLKEYRLSELVALLRAAGFTHLRTLVLPVRVTARLPAPVRRRASLPASAKAALDPVIERLPRNARTRVGAALGLTVIGVSGIRPR